MKRRILSYGLGVAAVLFGAAACSSDSTTAPGSAMNTEITTATRQDAGENAAMTVGQLTANDAFVGADVVTAPAAVVAGVSITCTPPDAGGWKSCTAVLENGLTITRHVRFWEGMSLGLNWNPGVTDSVNFAWTAVGTINSIAKPGKVWTIQDTTGATMNVIKGTNPQHSWSGNADRHQSSTYTVNSVERIFDHHAFDTVSAVVFQMPRTSNPYPMSGSITRNVTTVFTAGSFNKTVLKRIVVTFDGTHIAQLQDGAIVCDLDLDLRTISNCH